MRKISKRGNILTENIIFLVLNLLFVMILILFIFSRMGSATVLEERYAKQIALSLDSAEPGMRIHIGMEKAINKAKKELGEESLDDLVKINGNLVTVRLQEGSGYTYSFFNDVDVASPYLDPISKTEYVFIVDEK